MESTAAVLGAFLPIDAHSVALGDAVAVKTGSMASNDVWEALLEEISPRRGFLKAVKFIELSDDDFGPLAGVFCPSISGILASRLRYNGRDLVATCIVLLETEKGGDTLSESSFEAVKTLQDWIYSPPAKHPYSFPPPVHTITSEFMFSRLVKWAYLLSANEYEGDAERHSKILTGARGTGKSIALQRFAVVASVLFPDIRVVYIDCTNVEWESDALQKGLIATLMHVLRVEPPPPGSKMSILEALFVGLGALRVFLIIDEMDALYREKKSKKQRFADRIQRAVRH
jgi:hypothetical protein